MAGDPAFRDWWAAYLRMGASPAAAVALTRMNARDRRPTRAADDPRPDAGAAPDRRPLPARGGRPLRGEPDPRRALRRAARARTTCRSWATRRHARRDRAVPGRARRRSEANRVLATILCAARATRERARPRTRERCSRWSAPKRPGSAAPSVQRDGDAGVRGVRRSGPRDPVRVRDWRGGARRRPAARGRTAHRGVRLAAGAAQRAGRATSARAWPRWAGPARCWSRGPSSTWWPAPACTSRTVARTGSPTACTSGACSRSTAAGPITTSALTAGTPPSASARFRSFLLKLKPESYAADSAAPLLVRSRSGRRCLSTSRSIWARKPNSWARSSGVSRAEIVRLEQRHGSRSRCRPPSGWARA